MELVLTLTHIVNLPKKRKQFGFARDERGTEYFVPRALIARHGLTEADLGRRFNGRVANNPRPLQGRDNQAHVLVLRDFIDD